jgi:hypothetical protein
MSSISQMFSRSREAQYEPTTCSPASCANGKCQATGECIAESWPVSDREYARAHVEISERHCPPLVPVVALRTIIAFTGLAGAGKSTAALHLVKRHGFERIRFAGPLKAMMAALGCTGAEIDGDRKELPCELLGGKTPRWAMQSLGTEWGRDLIARDLWIRAFNAALAKVPAGVPVTVDDCRFPNEAEAVLAAGGIIVRIERPGAGTASVHSSEAHALPASRTLHNTLSASQLCHQVDIVLGDLSWADRDTVA